MNKISENDLKILQTVMFLLEDSRSYILRNNLMPYFKKAERIKRIIREDGSS